MPRSTRRADSVVRPDWKRVRSAMRRLTSVVEAETIEEAERGLDRLIDRVTASPENTEAAFAAAQTLRDLGTIDLAEAACVFDLLYEADEEDYEDADPELQRILKTVSRAAPRSEAAAADDIKRFHQAVSRRMDELRSEFHRARGEHAIAALILRDEAEYHTLVATGYDSLVCDKPSADESLSVEPDPKKVAVLCERIIALAASETGRETYQQWEALVDASDLRDPASDVAAVRNVRTLGLVTEHEAMNLIHAFLDAAFVAAISADRPCAALRRAMEALEHAHGLAEGTSFPEGEAPFEWRVLESRLERRAEGVMACCLRRHGEHAMANLLVEHRAEYYRIVDELGIGAWGAPG